MCTILVLGGGGAAGVAIFRQIFDYLMSYELPPTSPIFHEIDNLKLMDMNIGKEDQTYAKHICKRTGNCTISPKFQIGTIRITGSDLTEI